MARKLIAVVTGSNRGIGSGIVEQLAATKHPRGPLVIYATSRGGVTQEIGTQHENEVRFEKLDVSDQSSILGLLSGIERDSGSSVVDILINNAGVNLNQNETYEDAQRTIEVNYRSVRDMCRLFLDKGGMKGNQAARIVNVSSTGSALGIHSNDVQERFRSAKAVQEVDGLADEYLGAYKDGSLESSGFGKGGRGVSYQVSKACVNALTRALARENNQVLINACCPGWVDTDMGKIMGRPPKSIADGAKIPVRLAVGDIGEVSGEYWGNDGVYDTGDGKIQQW